MKTKKRDSQGLLPQTRSNRWKWMARATAAGMTASQAGAITINLVNNYISADSGNHLNADLTGDGHPDLTIANAFNSQNIPTSYGRPRRYYGNFYARVNLNGVLAQADRFNDAIPSFGIERLGSRVMSFYRVSPDSYFSYSLTGTIPLFFKDLHINGGAPTSGFLQVTVSTRYSDGAEIQLDSFSYNAPLQGLTPTVSDQGSSLALLALGAGGVLAVRRWRASEAHS